MNIYRINNSDILKELQNARNLAITNAELTNEVKQLKQRIKDLEAKNLQLCEKLKIQEIRKAEPTPAMLINALPELAKQYENINITTLAKDAKTGEWREVKPRKEYKKRTPTTLGP